MRPHVLLLLLLIGASSLRANSYLIDEYAPFVRGSENGDFILRFEPVRGKDLRTVSVFKFDHRKDRYVRVSQYKTGNRYDWHIVVEKDGTTLYLNPRYEMENSRAPVFEVLASDGKVIDTKTLSELLEAKEVEAFEAAAKEANKSNTWFAWLESFHEVNGRYWLKLDESHRVADRKYQGDYLFVWPRDWSISRGIVDLKRPDEDEEVISRPKKQAETKH